MKAQYLVFAALCAASFSALHADVGSDLVNAVSNNDEGAARRFIDNRELGTPYLQEALKTAIDNHNEKIVAVILDRREVDFSDDDLRQALKAAVRKYGLDDAIVRLLIGTSRQRGLAGQY